MKVLFNNKYKTYNLNLKNSDTRNRSFLIQKPDTVSFGMANIGDDGDFELNQIRVNQKRFETNIRQHIVSIPDTLLFLQDHNGVTQFMRALYDEHPNNAMRILDYVKDANFDLKEKKKFFELKDKDGNSQFDVAIKTKYYEIAMKLLKLMAKINPEKVVDLNIPEEIYKMISFPRVVDIMIENEALSKEQTLKFLDKNMEYVPLYEKRRALVEDYADIYITDEDISGANWV
ncbi:MAG TPA: hypothetical protein PLG15_01750 [Candidatus Gastranaerophilaceae bacterium]|nr:hypothetical protein [Candidatus Gastranaerophilaceae bacterium]HPT41087.1 hypothetical protein [Candidatus Gastranaerophilaceae bacterium]